MKQASKELDCQSPREILLDAGDNLRVTRCAEYSSTAMGGQPKCRGFTQHNSRKRSLRARESHGDQSGSEVSPAQKLFRPGRGASVLICESYLPSYLPGRYYS